VGGGSTTGLAKAIALKTGRPIVSVPTTYAGSESTAIYGLTEGGAKRTGRDSRVLPSVVIYDPLLSSDLPLHTSVTSGLNAIAHAVEGLYARDVNPLMELMAQEGIHVLSHGLVDLRAGRNKEEARSRCLYGSWLCGIVLGSAGMALHHKLCHILGGSFNLPHAETHAVVLPYVVAYNAPAAPEAMARVAIALGADNAAEGIFDLVTKLEAPRSLKGIGMNEADVPKAVTLALKEPYYNPRSIDAQSIAKLLEDAFLGERPDKQS
jgi:maleylacetate reductase